MRQPTATTEHDNAGFSMVELLVVIAIIGAILCLLIPAMHQARGAALRVQCLNNLRQIGLALHNYESRSGVFPVGYVTGFDADGKEDGPGWSWAASCLPNLEQTMLFQSIDFESDALDPASLSAVISHLTTFTCPTDRAPKTWEVRDGLPSGGPPRAVLGEIASASYVGVAGPGPLGPDSGGIFARNIAIRFTDVRDGLSQTLAVGERCHTLGPATWVAAIPDASLSRSNDISHPTIGGPSMVLGRITGNDGPGGPKTPPDGFRGNHAVPGAHFAFADGSVRFLGASISPEIYRALSTRAGGEMIPDED